MRQVLGAGPVAQDLQPLAVVHRPAQQRRDARLDALVQRRLPAAEEHAAAGARGVDLAAAGGGVHRLRTRQARARQLDELRAGVQDLRELLALDYARADGTPDLTELEAVDATELLDPLVVARAMGYVSVERLEAAVTPRGYRQVAQINRLPVVLGRRLIEHFGSLQALFAASAAELQDVDGVGDGRARLIRDGLVRLAEAGYTERLD